MSRSRSCDQPVQHRFNNSSDFVVDCVWVDYDGNEATYAKLGPGATHLQGTFAEHPWRLRRAEGGALLREYEGGSATLTVLPDGSVRVEAGVRAPVPPETRSERWGVFRRRGRCFRGLGIHAFDCVGDEAVAVAAHTLDYMLEAVPEPVLERLRRGGAVLAVIGAAQVTSDIPQHAYMKGAPRGAGTVDSSTRGLGGHPAIPVTSVGEENLVMRDDAGYAGESLLLHEFAHAVMDIGLGGQPLHDEILACWEAARGRGTYEPKSYIISNAGEYWAEGTQAWFEGTMRDDVTSGIKTRAALKAADPWLASLMARVYGDNLWRYWHTSPAPMAGDEGRWRQGLAMGAPRAGTQPPELWRV